MKNPELTHVPLYAKIIPWLRTNLFSSLSNTAITFFLGYLLFLIIPPIINWGFLQASFFGQTKQDCLVESGACWVFIKVRLGVFMYGFYPDAERWRIDMALIMMLFSAFPILLYSIRHQFKLSFYCIVFSLIAGMALFFLSHKMVPSVLLIGLLLLPLFFSKILQKKTLIFNLVCGFFVITIPSIVILFTGGFFGLTEVSTDVWGGLSLTIIVASTGILGSLPLGMLLALGRQSKLPVINVMCVTFIEFLRGVPLISVLFMASIMLPLFLSDGMSVNKLLRALIGVAVFYSAYMAEVIRGGLQTIPKGQYEGSDSLGLSYWQKMRLIILPQALRLVIPGLINNVLGLFKDTTLVAVIGLLDLLGTIKTSLADTQWLGFSKEAYFFAAIVFWFFCFLISQYGKHLEKYLHEKQNSPN